MGLLDLITNTVEGAAQVAVNVVKAPVGIVALPLDDGQTVKDAAAGVVEGLEKVGKTEKETPNV
jgi:hypothetical protein